MVSTPNSDKVRCPHCDNSYVSPYKEKPDQFYCNSCFKEFIMLSANCPRCNTLSRDNYPPHIDIFYCKSCDDDFTIGGTKKVIHDMTLPQLEKCPKCGNEGCYPRIGGSFLCGDCKNEFFKSTWSCRCGRVEVGNRFCFMCSSYSTLHVGNVPKLVKKKPSSCRCGTEKNEGYYCTECNSISSIENYVKPMPTLYMYQGLPASGKTQSARAKMNEAPDKFVRVNKDEIRATLKEDGWVWSHENEKKVLAIRDKMIINALKAGKSVISDDTNFSRKHKARFEELCKECKAILKVEFMNTPVGVCIQRDKERPEVERVGEKVIRDMAIQYSLIDPSKESGDPFFHKVDNNEHHMEAIICDLDNTLCILNGRDPYYAEKLGEDEVNVAVKKVISIFHKQGVQIIYTSGREDKYKSQTGEWLLNHFCPLGILHMRKTGDHRKDWIVKGEIFNAAIRDKYNVLFVLDDREQVVDFWRKLGLTVFDVAGNKF